MKKETWNPQKQMDKPTHWRKPREVTVKIPESDLFAEEIPFAFVAAVFGVMAACPQHEFQILTKRPERIWNFLQYLTDLAVLARGLFPHDSDTWRLLQCLRGAALKHGVEFPHGRRPAQVFPLPHVWLGVSVEDQATANERIPLLLKTPAAKRFLSIEPLLGPVDLTSIRTDSWAHGSVDTMSGYLCGEEPDALFDYQADPHGWVRKPASKWERGRYGLDLVIVGGESGPKARPMHPDWVRAIRDQCQEAGVPFHFKQWGNWGNGSDRAGKSEIVLNDGRHGPDAESLGYHGSEDREGRHWNSRHPTMMTRFAHKKTAGRLLDGEIHDG